MSGRSLAGERLFYDWQEMFLDIRAGSPHNIRDIPIFL